MTDFYSEISKLAFNICTQYYEKSKKQNSDVRPYIVNGELSLNSAEQSLAFLLDCLQNEFDTITNAVIKIERDVHNDRLAKILSAMQQYKKALNTIDENIKKNTLVFADNDLTYAVNALKQEIQKNIDDIQKIPTRFIEKMFSKVKLEQIDTWLNMVYDSTHFFIVGVCCLVEMNKELSEESRMIDSMDEYAQFLKCEFSEHNIKLLISYDLDENENKWYKLQQHTQEFFRLAENIPLKKVILEEYGYGKRT